MSEWVALAVRVSVSAWLLAWLACRVGWLVLSLRLSFSTSWCPLFFSMLFEYFLGGMAFGLIICNLFSETATSSFLNLSGISTLRFNQKNPVYSWGGAGRCGMCWIALSPRPPVAMSTWQHKRQPRRPGAKEVQEVHQFQKRFQHRTMMWCKATRKQLIWK